MRSRWMDCCRQRITKSLPAKRPDTKTMRYLPKSPADREEMLAEIGVGVDRRSVFDDSCGVSAEARSEVPRQHGESEIIDRFRAFAENNAAGYASFLGAGVYRHYRPVIIDSLVQRGEFLTSYTPYQPEISQGTLQAMFEFQTMICELTGMEIANASMYDGSTGAAEAIMMAVRVTGRDGAVIARTVHPEYREVIATYAQHQEIPTAEVGYAANGRVDLAALDAAITKDTACVLIQSPNFFGTIEDVAAIAEIAHAKGALLIVSIAEAVSLGIVRPPAEADIVSLEAQSFGVAVGYGGPYCGVIACKEKFLRQMPGRLDRRDEGYGWQARICADAVDARAAYPAGEGDFEHLHEPGAGCDDDDDLPDGVWQGGDEGAGGAESGEGGLFEGRAWCFWRREGFV